MERTREQTRDTEKRGDVRMQLRRIVGAECARGQQKHVTLSRSVQSVDRSMNAGRDKKARMKRVFVLGHGVEVKALSVRQGNSLDNQQQSRSNSISFQDVQPPFPMRLSLDHNPTFQKLVSSELETEIALNQPQQERQFYYTSTHEFMRLEDFLHFHHNFIQKRVADKTKEAQRRALVEQVEQIKTKRAKQFVQKEVFENHGSGGHVDAELLAKKCQGFCAGLDFSLSTLKDQQIVKAVRMLSATPQPPLRLSLNWRMRQKAERVRESNQLMHQAFDVGDEWSRIRVAEKDNPEKENGKVRLAVDSRLGGRARGRSGVDENRETRSFSIEVGDKKGRMRKRVRKNSRESTVAKIVYQKETCETTIPELKSDKNEEQSLPSRVLFTMPNPSELERMRTHHNKEELSKPDSIDNAIAQVKGVELAAEESKWEPVMHVEVAECKPDEESYVNENYRKSNEELNSLASKIAQGRRGSARRDSQFSTEVGARKKKEAMDHFKALENFIEGTVANRQRPRKSVFINAKGEQDIHPDGLGPMIFKK